MTPTPPKVYPGLCAPFTQSPSGLFPRAVIDRRDIRDVRYLGTERPVRVERARMEYQR